MDITPIEELGRNTNSDLEEDGLSPDSPIRESDEITNNVFLTGRHLTRAIGESEPVYIRHGPYYEPVDESTDNNTARVPRYPVQESTSSCNFNIEQNRYESFRGKWPQNSPVSPDDLAKAGFKYLGPNDRVQCVFCNGVLSRWENGDNPFTEHKKHFPNCNFVKGHNVNNIPYRRHVATVHRNIPAQIQTTLVPHRQSPQDPKHPQYRIKSDRLVTFNDWPSQMKQKPEDLAEAGLFYLGQGDKVKCFVCDGMLHSWEATDVPWIEHARWFPDCEYVKLMKGEDFIKAVAEGRIKPPQQKERTDSASSRNEDMGDAENSPEVQAVLAKGNTMEQIKKAFENLGIRTLEDIPKAGKILKTIIKMESSKYPASRQSSCKESMVLENSPDNEEFNSLVEENNYLKEQKLCKICLEREISVLFLPCGHVCCCGSCAMSVQSCPICRNDIERRVKAFLP